MSILLRIDDMRRKQASKKETILTMPRAIKRRSTGVNRSDHFKEYMNRLRRHNDPDQGRRFTAKGVLEGSLSYYYDEDTELMLQVYGDYITDVVKALFPPTSRCCHHHFPYPYELYAFVRPFTESLNTEEKCLLYFTTALQINGVSYEVIVEKQEFVDGVIAAGRWSNKKEFNQRTRDLIVSVVTRLMNLGNDNDGEEGGNNRRIAIPLPAN